MTQTAPTSARNCARCGTELPLHTLECPRCLLQLGLGSPGSSLLVDSVGSAAGTRTPRSGPPPTLEEVRAAFPALEIDGLLGQGGMGAVFRARQPRLERSVALKVLPRALGEDPDFAERFLREARALARLSHPGIVTVHDFGCADGLHYLLMELVEGTNLRTLLRQGPLEPQQALAIARELCEALQYAHDEGVVHRDIKPENVLIDARGRVKVADFGLVKLVGNEQELLTRSDQVMGTPHYMAPEQMERPLEVDHRADLFALGVVLYEMLTGSLPRGAFELPSQRVQVDVQLDRIVLKALEREPTRRYQHALEIKTDVDHCGPTGATSAPADPTHASGAEARSARGETKARDGAGRRAESGPEHGWRAVLLFALAWILLGVSWNLGPFATGVGIVLVVAALTHVLRARVRAVPEWSAAFGALPAADRAARSAMLLIGSFLGVLLIVIGHVLHWEKGTHTWRPTLHGVNGGFEVWSRDPWSLLRFVCPNEDVLGFFSADSNPQVGVVSSRSSFVGGTGSLDWLMILGGFVILGLALAATVRLRSSSELSRRAWSLGAELSTWALLALLLLWIGSPIASLRKHQVLQEIAEDASTPLVLEQTLDRVQTFLEGRGLEFEVEQYLAVTDRKSSQQLARALVLRASSPDPFERWGTSFGGAVRETPQLWITIAARVDGMGSRVRTRAGLLDPREPQFEAVHALLADLEKAVAP